MGYLYLLYYYGIEHALSTIHATYNVNVSSLMTNLQHLKQKPYQYKHHINQWFISFQCVGTLLAYIYSSFCIMCRYSNARMTSLTCLSLQVL